MKKIIFTLLGILAVLSANAQWGPQSKVVTDSVFSEVLNDYRQFNVYLPKSFDVQPSKQYPILYLLHGIGDTNHGWTHRGHIQDVMDQLTASGEVCEMIIVTPCAGGSFSDTTAWQGYFNMPGWNYEDFFFKEFMPAVEKKYRVVSARSHRAIAGLSMGGGGATSYAQRHSELFCAVYAMSALMNIPDFGQPAPDPTATDKMSLLNLSVMDKSCIDFVNSADESLKEKLRSLKWFVDCGDDDFLLQRNIEFVQAMKKAEIPLELRVRDGAHTWEYWHSALYTALPFVSRCFNQEYK